MGKKNKDKKKVYVLTPKGWIEMIRIHIKRGEPEEALKVCNTFDEWCDTHLVYKEK